MLNNEKGLTLIEILASIVILSIVIVSFTNISKYVTLYSSKSDKATSALQLADKKLTQIKNTNATTMQNISTIATSTTSPNAQGYSTTVYETAITTTTTVTIPNFAHNVSMDAILTLNNAGAPVTRLITVIVSWR